MAIEYVRVGSVPSIGTLSRFNSLAALDEQDERHSYIRSYFSQRGGSSYFNSSSDRYSVAFRDTIDKHVNSASRAARRIRDSLALTSTEDVIRPCTTERSLRCLPTSMYRPILSMPSMYRLLRLDRIQGWGGLKAEDIREDVDRYTRILDVDGKLDMHFTPTEEEPEQYIEFSFAPGDPMLTARQILDIMDTRDYVQRVLDGTELDPTDLDMVRQ